MERDPAAERRLAALLAKPAVEHGIHLDPILSRLQQYADLLLRWNERVNLSGARTLDAVARDLIADAFPIIDMVPESGTWIDVGSGAGLPGVVVAICRPHSVGVLLEPNQKRRAFLSLALRTLELGRVSVLGQRLSEHTQRDYDVAMSRAVFDLREWLDEGTKLVKPAGSVVGFASMETARLVPTAEVTRYDVGAGQRAIVRIRK